MNRSPFRFNRSRQALLAALLLGSSAAALAVDIKVTLSGDQEVPPVKSAGAGSAFFAISNDGKVTGQVNVVNIKPLAAHVHEAAPGAAGPIVFPLVRSGDTSFTVPPNVLLNAAQQAALKDGKLYVNVHTEANPGGELRAQLKP
jgi:hypothetical protein